MTRTPCADNPEMWVGNNLHGRLEAARRCLICPALTACGIDALSGATFERPAKASQKQWEARVVCGLSCSARKNSPRRAAA